MSTNQQALIEGFQDALSESLESLAFLEVQEAEILSRLPEFNELHRMVTVGVSKPLSGKMHFVLPDTFISELAETVVEDADDGISDSAKKDIIAELANTIAGRVLAHVYPEMEFEMGIPECSEAKNYVPGAYEHSIYLKYDAEGTILYALFEYSEI